MDVNVSRQEPVGLVGRLNGRHHRTGLNLFLVIVVAHWAEHLTQAYQIWVLGWPVKQSRGVLGQFYPWLVSSEWLHYGYALVMLVGLWLLRSGFTGRSRAWWLVAFGIQFFHHVEHLLLFVQAQAGVVFFGQAVPTSLVQLVAPRVELHLFYNTAVFLPMIVAMVLHLRPNSTEAEQATCTCAPRPVLAVAGRS
ncbi:hypothetical protein GA0070616_4955 [Micromonospora nigra]|uniref:Uncharacterized protein n=1 Tax=Micromonospora nigra TaxID=145857 RepID=A0A1C6SYJ3_9ACTN|nr:hypothetical protein [Micromonospora nigra]SCL34382.1 hypothetical protein GA0070616_4955 [Micromonospora nigra]